jgi:hypothetical protein
MEEVVKWLLEWAKDSPIWVAVIASTFVAVSMGPAYIKAISEALSRKRHDDVQLLEKEERLKRRLESLGNRKKLR